MIDVTSWPSVLLGLLPGLWVSIRLLLAVVLVGTVVGLGLAVALRSPLTPVRVLAIAVTEVGRGVPALVLLYLVYFGLPSANLTLSAFLSATLALGVNFGAYTSEVFRAGLDSVGRGQSEAAMALGLSPTVGFFQVVLPQAVRVITPSYLSWVIVYFQTTSLAFAIAVPELISAAYTEANNTFEYLSVLVLAGLVYAVITVPASRIVARLENRQASEAH